MDSEARSFDFSNDGINTEVLPEHLDAFRHALQTHSLEIPEDRHAALCQYALVLWQWNERLNLTRHTDWDRFVGRDLRDTLQLSAQLEPGEEVLDVGSAGGVPGLTLALLRDDLEVTLTESVTKKAKALGAICKAIEAPVAVHNARAEDLIEDFRFDSVIGRAVGPLWKFCTWFAPHWASFYRMVLIKGPNWPAERAEARQRGLMANLTLRKLASYETPGADGESVILEVGLKARES